MPIETIHPLVFERANEYQLLRDELAGQKAMIDAGERYVPILARQNMEKYMVYLKRGHFYGALQRTIQGLAGAIMRKGPFAELPPSMDFVSKEVTRGGIGLSDVAGGLCAEVLAFGRAGIFVDIPDEDNSRAYFSLYKNAQIRNWFPVFPSRSNPLRLLLLSEATWRKDETDEYKMTPVERIRELRLDGGSVTVTVWEQRKAKDSGVGGQWVVAEEPVTMMIMGRPLTEIPFFSIGLVPKKPPLLDLAYTNLQHWKVSVDYYHGVHYCALPTPCFFGFSEDDAITLGPGAAVVNRDPSASASMLEFTGQGLGSVRETLSDLEKKMAVQGARLIEEQKRSAEAAETVRLRQAGESATLSVIAAECERCVESALKKAAEFVRTNPEEISFKLNRDFVSSRLGAQDVTALLQALQAGTISQDTFLWNLKQGEIIPAERSIEEEKELIEAVGAGMFGEG